MTAEPDAFVVWGEAVARYDFGPEHPLTPRRFGPGIDLLRATGAATFLEPAEATDAELARLHDAAFVRDVRSFSADPWQPPRSGIGPGDTPPFQGMHEAAATIAGGSIKAARRIAGGEARHGFNPGGGLHHAMADRAGGFCIYNDIALAAAVARDAGHRVLYVDLDVHHGDGTQALFWDDPAVLTLSIHETGRSLFPGTGFPSEQGGPAARGTAVNIPLEPFSGDPSWLDAVETSLPALAAAFRPTFLVSQHGCDSHVWDPLAHLRVTTDAYARATRLLDRVAHEHCEGRWLASGGGGYDAYRVVPRSWALVHLAQAHREVPDAMPADWIERWRDDTRAWTGGDPPAHYLDPPGLAPAEPEGAAARNGATTRRSVEAAVALLASA